MHAPAALSRLVLVAAIILTGLLAWSSARTTDLDVAVAPIGERAVSKPTIAAPLLTIAVDASDLPRGLLRSTVTWDVHPGRMWLRFPRWLQGTHAPCGTIENLSGLVVHGSDGAVLPWSRDPRDVYRFTVVVPNGCSRLSLDLTYLANQPTVNSQPVDVLEINGSATVNWNDCLLYPEGWNDDRIAIAASLRLPAGWRQACALTSTQSSDGAIAYEKTDLRALIDSPVLCGRVLDVHDIVVAGCAPHRIAVTTAASQPVPPRALSQLAAVAAEAQALFGGAPFTNYTWLLGVGEHFPHLGLEHLACSLNGIDQDGWCNDNGLESAAAFLLTHEYGHAWCGKHHRPAGMVANDCHTNLDTRLLWVYEGFDQYIGMLLAARSGATDRTTWIARMAAQIKHVEANHSRSWRTLEDTASASHTLRKPSANWSELRGSQDYYLEGMLLCLQADGLIRRASGGKRSFDDVLRRFLAPQAGATVVPFSESDVIACLHAVEPSIDWATLIERLVRKTTPAIDLSSLKSWGMEATWKVARPNIATAMGGYLNDRSSIGLVLWKGQIVDIEPNSPADQARLAPEEHILQVNEQELNLANWTRALAAGATGAPLRLHVRGRDQSERDVVVPCPSGPRYLDVAPSPDADDRAILDAIIAPRSAEGRAVRAAGGGW